MCIYLLILEARLDNVSAEDRFFLIRFLHRFGLETITAKGVVDLAGILGLDQIPVDRAIRNLSKAGYFVSGNRVLGQQNYLCSSKLRDMLASLAADRLPVIHEKLIEKLIFGMADICDNKGRLLKHSHRLLFAVLLFHADVFGVVRNLSISDLLKLTGMKLDRLEYQLTQLSRNGYIRGRVSGVTGAYLFGMVKGVFFLNAHHNASFISDPAPNITMGIFDFPEGDMADRCFQLAHLITNHAHLCVGNLGLPECDYDCVKLFFKDTRASRVDQLLQLKLEEYAIYIIKDLFRNKPNDAVATPPEGLMDKIYSELFPESMSKKRITLQKDRREFARYIYELSLQMAQCIQNQFEFLTKSDSNNVDIEFVILPFNQSRYERMLAVWRPNVVMKELALCE